MSDFDNILRELEEKLGRDLSELEKEIVMFIYFNGRADEDKYLREHCIMYPKDNNL